MDEDEEMYRLMNEDDEFYMGDTDDEDEDLKEEPQADRCSRVGCIPLIVILLILWGMIL